LLHKLTAENGTFGPSPVGRNFGRNWGYFPRAHGPAGMRVLDPIRSSSCIPGFRKA